MRTMNARYRSRCTCGCDRRINPGDRIAVAGKGNTRLAACVGRAAGGPDRYNAINPVTGERMSDHARVVVTTFASGDSVTRNARGRCEDAPCCGCCT